jgi:hypothetical protein
MRKLLAMIGVSALLTIGLLVGSPLKGSIVQPQTASACAPILESQALTSTRVFDYYYYQYTYVNMAVNFYFDTCTNDFSAEAWETVDDQTPGTTYTTRISTFWYPTDCGQHTAYSGTTSMNYLWSTEWADGRDCNSEAAVINQVWSGGGWAGSSVHNSYWSQATVNTWQQVNYWPGLFK